MGSPVVWEVMLPPQPSSSRSLCGGLLGPFQSHPLAGSLVGDRNQGRLSVPDGIWPRGSHARRYRSGFSLFALQHGAEQEWYRDIDILGISEKINLKSILKSILHVEMTLPGCRPLPPTAEGGRK